jgi:catechol 2,3-dioxygenase-like lactoylglutathione lyase family enzyme
MDDYGQPAEGARSDTLRRDHFLKRAAILGVGASGLLAAAATASATDKPPRHGEHHRANGGLRLHVNRFSHLTINVSDLERAKAFYEATLPLKVVARTNGPAQAYPSLGLTRGRFDGYMLRDSQAYPSRAIHLVEWKDPKPVGKPYETFVNVGIYRASHLTPDIEASYRQVLAAGGVPWGPPSNIIVTPEGDGVLSFGFKDPDGTTLQYLGDPTQVGPGVSFHENINCRSLARSFPFYQDVLGLDYIFRRIAREPQAATVGALGQGVKGQIFFDAPFLGHRADQRNPVDLLEWKMPKPYGRPYRSPFNLGMIRLSIEVDDIDEAREKLIEGGVKGVSETEEWDMGEFGTRKVVMFRDPDGVFLELIQRPPYASELAPPFESPF